MTYLRTIGLAVLALSGCAQPHATDSGRLEGSAALPRASADQPVHGKADVLRDVPKTFATYLGFDPSTRQVKLHIEGKPEPSTWTVLPDAEIKVHGWWGRLDQLHIGDRVWVWFAIDRRKTPTGILLLADEISEQDLHNLPSTIESVDPKQQTVTIRSSRGDGRVLSLVTELHVSLMADRFELLQTGKPAYQGTLGDSAFVQTAGGTVRLLMTAESLDRARQEQKVALRERWRKEGLPGTVTFLHPLGGEMEVMLDHEAIRWGRYLRAGDRVILDTAEPIKAVVKHVQPWRERTQLRLVTESGRDQADLVIGQRVYIQILEPPSAVQNSDLPTDVDRPRPRDERVEWFLSTVYCPCSIAKDRCTGMVYTQASCNATECGMAKRMRSDVTELIGRELTDSQILLELRDRHGSLVLRPHLLQ